jgi:hypothetical protein
MKRNPRLAWLACALVLVAAGCSGTSVAPSPMTLADARSLAAERGVPLLLDFYTDW